MVCRKERQRCQRDNGANATTPAASYSQGGRAEQGGIRHPLAQLAEVAREVGGLSGITLAVGVACLAPLLLLRWRAPKIPGPLLVVIQPDRRIRGHRAGFRGRRGGRRDPTGPARHRTPRPGSHRRAGPAAGGAWHPFVSFSDDIDATGVDTLTELIRSLQQQQITFVFACLKGPMRQHLQEAGVLGLVHLYPTVRAAVQAASVPPRAGEGAGTGERADGEGEPDPRNPPS
jgi:hypothetical protein